MPEFFLFYRLIKNEANGRQCRENSAVCFSSIFANGRQRLNISFFYPICFEVFKRIGGWVIDSLNPTLSKSKLRTECGGKEKTCFYQRKTVFYERGIFFNASSAIGNHQNDRFFLSF